MIYLASAIVINVKIVIRKDIDLMGSLLFTAMISFTLYYSLQLASLNNCPWGLQTAVIQSLLERLQQLVQIFLDSLVVMILVLMVFARKLTMFAKFRNKLQAPHNIIVGRPVAMV